MKKTLLALFLAGTALFAAAAENILPLPFKQDPPISVDGNLSDWSDAECGIITLNSKKNMLDFGKVKVLPSEKDFSATCYFSWKPIGIYFAAKVKDDKLMQKGNDLDFFNGDHVELFIDVAPDEKDQGALFGKKQFHIGISPGNFADLKPAIYTAYPEGKKLPNSFCAAEKTDDGWDIEAFISWKDLGEKEISLNKVIGLTAWIADADVDEGNKLKVEHYLTTGKTDAQFRVRADLNAAVFADSNGKHQAVIASKENIPLGNLSIISSTSKKLEFTLKQQPGYLTPVLRLNGNLRTKHKFSGYARALQIYVNGKELNQNNLIKPENDFYSQNGGRGKIYQIGCGYLLPYTNDGKAGNVKANTKKFFATHYNMHEFVLDLSNLLKVGKNTITIKNSLSQKNKYYLDATDIKISFESIKSSKIRKTAPTGKIPVIKLQPCIPLTKDIKQNNNVFEITMPGGKYFVTSRFSTPDGKWVTSSNKYFKHQRTVEKKDELLVVKDTFTNLTGENLPLMQQHTIKVPGGNSELYLCGLEYKSGKNIRRSIGNFSAYAGNKSGGGIGLYPMNPEFQLHSGTFIPAPDQATLCDDQFVVPPGKTYTQEFVLVPLENGRYYDFVNVVRRHLKINDRTLNGPGGTWYQYSWMETDNFYKRLSIYNLNDLIVDLAQIGRPFLVSPFIPAVKKKIVKLRKTKPGMRLLRYYHSQIESDKNMKHKGGEVLLKNGKQALYGHSRLYLNLEGTEYSIQMEKVIDDLLENWDIDGIYWDEFASSGVDYHYGQPWDNCSADIHPVTHKITSLKSSCWILQRPWKNRMVDKIKAKGKALTANGGRALIAEFADKIEYTFTETQFDSNNTRVHFSTPISHANSTHMNRNRFAEYYDKMLSALDYGCLFTYSTISQPHGGPVYHTLTDHMYPATIMEIHNGYIIAKERILTNKSGMFGWEDNSKHTIYVYDHNGREVKNHKLKTVKINGKNYSEIRLAQDWSAVIVRN